MYDVKEFIFDKEKCWFKKNCVNYNKEVCNCGCKIYCQFYYLVNLANIPVYMQYPENQQLIPGKDANEFKMLNDIKENIVEWVENGNNLFLFSEYCGNGKTTWSIKLMCKYFSKIWPGNGTKCRGLFINVDEFFLAKQNSIKRPNARINEIERLIPEVDLVIWDDIGCTELSNYQHNILFPLINSRIINRKSNIFTSNSIDNDFAANVGERLVTRILETSDIIEFINTSHRKPISRRGEKLNGTITSN